MATKNWKGPGGTATPKSGNWSKTGNWSPSGVPGAGDDVVLGGSSTYTLTLNVSATVNSLTISDSGATLAIGTSTLTVAGTIDDQSGQIKIAGGKISAGSLALVSATTSSLSGWGTVAAPVSGSGTVTASGGTLDLTGTVSGITLVIATAAASDLKIDGTVTTTGAIAIGSSNQTLEIGAAGNLTINAAETITGGKIQLDGGTLTDAFGINFGTGGTLSGYGVLSATLSGGGTITTNGGILEFKNAVDSSAISTFQIANVAGSDLQLDSAGTTLSIYDSFGNSLGTIALAASYSGDKFSVSNGTLSVSVPAPPTVTVSSLISGPANTDNATLNGYWVIPPDNALAVSATDVLMAENNVIEIASRTGTVLLSPESTATFFASVDAGYSLTDPRALVDPVSGKFIVTSDALTVNAAGAVTGSAVVYAISNTTDPITGGWTFGRVNTTYLINGQATWADQPTIASNGSYLDITSAQFGVSSGQYVDNAVTIIPLSGGATTAYNLGNAADYRPVAVAEGDYFVGYTGNGLSILFNPNGTNTFTSNSISLGSIDVGNGSYTAPQLGSSVLLDAGFDDVANAVYANGDLYAVFEVVPPGTTQAAVHWVKVDAATDTLVAQGDITGPSGAVAFNPSIAVDANGDVLVNYTVSSSSMYPAAYASVMPAGSSSFLAPVQYGSSVAPETATFGVTNNVIRWGDYSTAVADPAAANSFVVSNEIVPSARTIFNNAPWSTVTATITLSPGTSTAVVASSSTTTSPTSSNTTASTTNQLVPLTIDSGTADALASSVAHLEAEDLTAFQPVRGNGFTFADIGNLGGTAGQDPNPPVGAGLLVDYTGSASPGSGQGYGTPVVDPTTFATADSLVLTIPHA